MMIICRYIMIIGRYIMIIGRYMIGRYISWTRGTSDLERDRRLGRRRSHVGR